MSSAKHRNSYTLPERDYRKRRNRFEMLANWYGVERAEVEIASHTRKPELIDGTLDQVLSEIRDHGAGVVVTLRSRWQEVVGNMFAGFCTPEDFRDGTLFIKVRHSALLAELLPMSDIFIRAVNNASPGCNCTAVKFI